VDTNMAESNQVSRLNILPALTNFFAGVGFSMMLRFSDPEEV
jgi:hypothetical protein